MSQYSFILTKEAESDLEKLDSITRKRILEKIKWFRDNFEQIIPLPSTNKWRGFFKLRVGDWRVIYEIDLQRKEIIFHYIDKRDKIYKRQKPTSFNFQKKRK